MKRRPTEPVEKKRAEFPFRVQACNHPFLFLDGGRDPSGGCSGDLGAEHARLVRASGKLAFLAHALPKLRATGEGCDADTTLLIDTRCALTLAEQWIFAGLWTVPLHWPYCSWVEVLWRFHLGRSDAPHWQCSWLPPGPR